MRDPCVWQNCVRLADDRLHGVHLVYEGRSITKETVPLCREHLIEAGRSGRCNLRPEFLFAQERR